MPGKHRNPGDPLDFTPHPKPKATTLAEYSQYKHVEAWGLMMGSKRYYITYQQCEAFKDGAPLNATYKDVKTGVWQTTDGLPPDHDVYRYLE